MSITAHRITMRLFAGHAPYPPIPRAPDELGRRPAGVGKSCLLLRFSEDSFTSSFITTIGCAACLSSPGRSDPSPTVANGH